MNELLEIKSSKYEEWLVIVENKEMGSYDIYRDIESPIDNHLYSELWSCSEELETTKEKAIKIAKLICCSNEDIEKIKNINI